METRDLGLLGIAIVCEVIATTLLKATESFTKPGPSVIVIIGYALAFYFFAACMNSISTGIAYAIWSGVGIILVTILGWLIYGQTLDLAGIIGILLILVGVMVLNLFSNTVVR